MSLSLAFHERLQQMDRARTHRLSLLQAEKELQANKSKVLASKLKDIRSIKCRCLLVERNIASSNFNISALKSQIEQLDATYRRKIEELRGLKSEVEELQMVEKEKDEYYKLKIAEMKEFMEKAKKFAVECRQQVEEHQSRFMNLQGDFGYTSNTEIADAEMRKSELLAIKENLDRDLASNYEIKSQLQQQLHSKFSKQN